MKNNDIETAKEFINSEDIETLGIARSMVAYADQFIDHSCLTAQDSEGQKSAEEILDKYEVQCYEIIDRQEMYWVAYQNGIKAMHEFANQSRPKLTDEEIDRLAEETYNDLMNIGVMHSEAESHRISWSKGAKWARTKLIGK